MSDKSNRPSTIERSICSDCGGLIEWWTDYSEEREVAVCQHCRKQWTDDSGWAPAFERVAYVAVDALRAKLEDGWSWVLGEFDAAVEALTGAQNDGVPLIDVMDRARRGRAGDEMIVPLAVKRALDAAETGSDS